MKSRNVVKRRFPISRKSLQYAFFHQQGFVYHVLSTASEWIMAAAVLAYFGTFIADFRKLGARQPQVFIIDDEEADFIANAQEAERLGDEVA